MAPVADLRRILNVVPQNLLVYSWSQPHSLDVTNIANPDITYCVNVYSSPCLSHAQSTTGDSDSINDEYSTCNITEPNITIDKQLGGDLLYRIEVLPRINLDVAPNGTRNVYQGKLIIL